VSFVQVTSGLLQHFNFDPRHLVHRVWDLRENDRLVDGHFTN
jgi:hypothetical protein